jgi:hypothetical protein
MAKKRSSSDIRISTHEKICAERMRQLVRSIEDLNKKVAKLTEDVSKGKGGVAVLMALGGLVIAVLGYFNLK